MKDTVHRGGVIFGVIMSCPISACRMLTIMRVLASWNIIARGLWSQVDKFWQRSANYFGKIEPIILFKLHDCMYYVVTCTGYRIQFYTSNSLDGIFTCSITHNILTNTKVSVKYS